MRNEEIIQLFKRYNTTIDDLLKAELADLGGGHIT